MSSLQAKRMALTRAGVPTNYVPGCGGHGRTPLLPQPTFAGSLANDSSGLGRGATGFTTRSDIGPARYSAPEQEQAATAQQQRNVISFGQAPEGYVPGAGRGTAGFGGKDDVAGEKEEDLGDSNYNEFYGYGGALFGDTPYEQDDQEADAVWDSVDQRMDGRRKERREALEKEELRKYRAKLPTLHSQFADIKREVDYQEDLCQRQILCLLKLKLSKQGATMNLIRDNKFLEALPQCQCNWTGTQSGFTDLNKVGEGRNTYLQLKLDRVSDSVSGQTVVDPKGYLTDLNSQIRNQAADVADIKQARLLLKSAITSNPKHAPAWIAASRLEVIKLDTSMIAALFVPPGHCRKGISSKKFDHAGDSDIGHLHRNKSACKFLCSIRSDPFNVQAKKIIAQAVHHLPTKVSCTAPTVSLWMRAAELEQEAKGKVKLPCPHPFCLTVAAEESSAKGFGIDPRFGEDAARVLLTRAVEDGCCPLSVDLWLALARLEEYQEVTTTMPAQREVLARKVLNNARKKVPSEPQIWFTAAKLEEANDNGQNVPKILERAMRQFADMKLKVSDDRDFWQQEAEKAEKGGYAVVAEGLIKVSADVNVLPHERRRVWEAEAEALLERGAVHCARTLYSCLLQYFNTKKKIWMAAASLEKKHGTPEALDQLLKKVHKACALLCNLSAGVGYHLLPQGLASLADGCQGEMAQRRLGRQGKISGRLLV
eukprot:767436-Hanusia_phi.AAC.13